MGKNRVYKKVGVNISLLILIIINWWIDGSRSRRLLYRVLIESSHNYLKISIMQVILNKTWRT